MSKLHVAGDPKEPDESEWETDNYKEWMRAQDDFGHSQQCRVNYPSHLTAAAERIMESGFFEFRSVADIFRVGFNRELKNCNDMLRDPEIIKTLTLEREECKQQQIAAKETAEQDFIKAREETWRQMESNRSPFLLESLQLARTQLHQFTQGRRETLLRLIRQYEEGARFYANDR